MQPNLDHLTDETQSLRDTENNGKRFLFALPVRFSALVSPGAAAGG
jgi:hypothetical protein